MPAAVPIAAESRPALDRESFPMRLWRKAKVHGVWNPDDIDFRADREAWLGLSQTKKNCVLQLCALFHAGEKAVTLDLIPLIQLVAGEGRMDEEIYLTSFLFEEAKHVDLFSRFLDEVCGGPGDLSRYYHQNSQRILGEELHGALSRLHTDVSVEAQVRASVTYNMVVEGIMADTGYHLFHRLLTEAIHLPGMQKAVVHLQRDEARHIAFGMYFLSRLIVEHGNRAYKAFLDRMVELKPVVEGSTRDFMRCFELEPALGIRTEELMRFSAQRFNTRVQAIMRARTQTLEELYRAGAFGDR